MSVPTYKSRVLGALAEVHDDYYGCSYIDFNAIAARSGVPRQHVRRAVRALAREGLAQFARGLWSEDGEPRGSGYAITAAGLAKIAEAA